MPPCPIPPRYDVAIIGAGIAGLTSAALLSKAGLSVVLLESEPRAGGYLASFHRKGFTFDSSIQWLNQCRPGGFLARIHKTLGDDGPRYVPLQRIHRYKGAGHDYLLTSNPLELRDRLIRDYPAESKGLKDLFRDAERLGHHMRFLDDRLRAAGTMSVREKLSHGLAMTRWVWPIRHIVSTSAEKGLARYFKTRELRDLFHSDGTLMSVLVPLGFAFTGDFQKPPEGGCSKLVDWLCGKISANGGLIRLNQPVREVLVSPSNEATGIRLASGETIHARYVIAACDVDTLFSRMLPPGSIPARRIRRLRRADLFYSSFSIYLGLDCPPAALGLNEELVRLTNNAAPPGERSGGEAATTVISLLAPSFRDPSLAPRGKGTLLIQCPAYLPQHNAWETGPGLDRGDNYRRFKQEFADALLDRVERDLIPGLRHHIEVMEVATPVTFLRYTGNRGGTIMGHKPTRNNIHAGLARLTTPVKRLLVGGQWAEYGGGVPMATKAAVNASLMILRDLRPDAFTALKTVVDGTGIKPLTIGIPRALYFFLYPSLFETFFQRLGLTTVVSPPTSTSTVEQAALISESEHCLPVKLLDAHLAHLIGKTDVLFVPRLLSGLKDHISCPKLAALPDAAIAQFGSRTRILTVDIHEGKAPLAESLLELGRQLGASDAEASAAARDAIAAMHAARRPPPRGTEAASKRMLLLAHPYNLHDGFISGPILTTLKRLGVDVQLMPFDANEVPPGMIKWDTCSKMISHLRALDRTDCAAVIQLTSFNCGCDSIVMEYHRDILKEKGIPYMTLVLDEHTAQAGLETRLEAFVDSTGW
jgi:phytoene dehydrogenase-like protein/predicted nucleotide-binding protein (sugar kinase/HSP70/actin superfamily)